MLNERSDFQEWIEQIMAKLAERGAPRVTSEVPQGTLVGAGITPVAAQGGA